MNETDTCTSLDLSLLDMQIVTHADSNGLKQPGCKVRQREVGSLSTQMLFAL